MRKHIAIIIPGGIGVGNFSQGIPALAGLIERIAVHHEVTVYSLVRVNKDFTPRGYRLQCSGITNEGPYYKKFRWLLYRLLRDHLRERYHLLHAFWAYPEGYLAVILGKFLRIPVIVSLQGGETACLPEIGYGNMIPGKRKKRSLWTCRHAGLLTVLTHFQKEALKKYGCRREDIRVIPFGADTRMFSWHEGMQKEPYNLIHVANLNSVKDQQTLLKAFSIIPVETASCLRIAGNGPEEETLKATALELNIADRVRFSGAIPHQELPAVYAAADILLHTSLYEAEGVAVAEAMASGVLVAGTRTGLIADLEGECCIAMEPGDYRGLATIIKELSGNSERIRQLRRNAWNWAVVHDADWNARQFLIVYETVFPIEEKNSRF